MTDSLHSSDLTAALNRVADVVSTSLAAAGKADQRRWRIALVFLTLGGPVLFALTAVIGVQQTTIRDNEHLIRRGVSCLLADLDDHRHTNQFAHETLADKHGFGPIQQPDVIPLTREQAEVLKQTCTTFIQRAIGQGLAPIAEKERR